MPFSESRSMAKLTRVYNISGCDMVLEKKDDERDVIRERRVIGGGKQVYLCYRDGFVSCNPDLQISYLVYPAAEGRSAGQTFLPYDVFQNSEIHVSYDTHHHKVALTYVRGQGFLHRISISRWFNDIFFR